MNIKTDISFAAPKDSRYYAWDDDTYDGAPDSGRKARIVGWGATEKEAIEDCRRQHEELEPIDADGFPDAKEV